MDVIEILKQAASMKASDIFLIGGLPLTYKINGRQARQGNERLTPQQLENLICQLYQQAGRTFSLKKDRFEDDFSFALPKVARFRINAFVQRGCLSAVIRILNFGIPSAAENHIPEKILDVANQQRGLILVTGATGSGKSTTIACIIDKMNQEQEKTIITMEDPIEFTHRHQKSIVIQREITTDSLNYPDALRASLRESPDVLFVGEMRDEETMSTALTAAETGRLVISSLHTISAADTIDRIVDSFPPLQQGQIRVQLSRVLQYIVCQKLVPGVDGELYPAFEFVKVNPAIRNLIREKKTYQLSTFIAEGRDSGMQSMNDSLLALLKQGHIDEATAIAFSEEPELLKKRLLK